MIIKCILLTFKGLCIDDGKSLTCHCKFSHYGDKCQYLKMCVSHTCRNGGACTEDLTNPAGYYCTCPQGIFFNYIETLLYNDC